MIGFILQAVTPMATTVADSTALSGATAAATQEMSMISMLFKGGFMMAPLMVCLAVALFLSMKI